MVRTVERIGFVRNFITPFGLLISLSRYFSKRGGKKRRRRRSQGRISRGLSEKLLGLFIKVFNK